MVFWQFLKILKDDPIIPKGASTIPLKSLDVPGVRGATPQL